MGRIQDRIKGFGLMLAVAGFFAASSVAIGQDSRPSAGQSAIERHVAAHSQGSVFSIYDSRAGKPLALQLVSIHTTAHPMKSGEVFYCADFKGDDGTEYDLDFYVNEKGEMPVVVDSFIHKAGGKDRIRPGENAKAVDEGEAAKIRKAISAGWDGPVELYDPRQGKKLVLTFDHVHDGVKALADGSFFACVDARDGEGVLYDLDAYVALGDGGAYQIVETLIHKRDGIERLR